MLARCRFVGLLGALAAVFVFPGCGLLRVEPRGCARATLPQAADPWFREGQQRLAAAERERPRTGRAKNVIVFIGDGMDLTTVTAARILEGQRRGESGEENFLAWERFPDVALAKTYDTNQQVPDSAGTATALYSGVKTKAGVIGVDSSVVRGDCASSLERHVTSLFELAEKAGMSTGVVTTTRITHATPAAAYGHGPERNWESDSSMPDAAKAAGCTDFARQLVEPSVGDGIDVALGGGSRSFLPQTSPDPSEEGKMGTRLDGRDLIAEWRARSPRSAVVWTARELAALDPAKTDRVLGLFNRSHMSFESERPAHEPSLEAMTAKAIELLAGNPAGFALLVEGGRIDHAHHVGNAYHALTETIELSSAVRRASGMTSPKDTLIVVTADHGHTLAMVGYPTRGNDILGKVSGNDASGRPTGKLDLAQDGKPYTTLAYANGPGAAKGPRADLTHVDTTAPGYVQQAIYRAVSYPAPGEPQSAGETHGGEDVPIWARGPGASLFQGTVEQSYVFHVIDHAAALRTRAGVQ
jgi:alkaline phosphatase